MFVKNISNDFERVLVDNHNFYFVAYSPRLQQYVMVCTVMWIASYDRYYKITENDYNLFSKDKEQYRVKFEKEISQQAHVCFNENFMGSDALRDYDGKNGFAQCRKSKERNAFQGYNLIDGVLYARIVWEDEEIYVPPTQFLVKDNGEHWYPLREKCELVYHSDGTEICYKLKQEFIH